jgi:hypothetical protein
MDTTVNIFEFLRSCCTSIAAARKCTCVFAPGLNLVEITQIEQKTGLTIPNELREFYQFSYGALLCEYKILTIPEIASLLLEIREVYGPSEKSMLPFAYLMGVGDFVAFDLTREEEGKNLILDGFHELPPDEWQGICFGLTIWLERLAQNQFEPFWLSKGKG